MRSIHETKRFQERTKELFPSTQIADEIVLFALTWRLSRADLTDTVCYPLVAETKRGPLYATATRDSYFGPAMIVYFTVEQNTVVQLEWMAPR